jgi:hypothetical protein
VIAVVVSVLLTFYLIIPETIFRMIFGSFVPTRNFVITGTETVKRAVIVALFPFAFALVLCWYVPGPQNWPFPTRQNTDQSRRSDYRVVAAAFYSDAEFAKSPEVFWRALTPCMRRQGRLVIWYLLLVSLEALISGKLAKDFPKYKNNKYGKWLSDVFLFRYISEWHPLLTSYLLPGHRVRADLLCTNNTLYQGEVSNHFLRDGQLTGIILAKPRRFDRERYLRARADGQKPDKEAYWVKIPSTNLYFFADKIFNMNLSYVTESGAPVDPSAIQSFIQTELGLSIKDLRNLRVSIKFEKNPAPKNNSENKGT